MPACRHSSGTAMPAWAFFRMVMICSSVNRLFFISSSSIGGLSFRLVQFLGAGQDPMPPRRRRSHVHDLATQYERERPIRIDFTDRLTALVRQLLEEHTIG